jgi:hypothetical protein
MRIIKSSLCAGMTDLALGGVFKLIGFADWYYNTFHVFGILGFGMIAYAAWHYIFYTRETR